nr:serine/threonine-protein kinase [Chiayiivirga flava]
MSDEIEAMRLFDAALQRAPHARAAWLATQPMSTTVAARVRALLDGVDEASDFLETPAAMPAFAALPQPGDRLGAWRIERELDAGGMGVVYLAQRADGAYEQRAAIKLVRTALDAAGHADLVVRFENERRLLARLDHPNVARVLDGGSSASGVPYLVMEYVDGVSLTRWCELHGLDVPARVALFCKVCDGVEAAHRHLIVHRDLKPQNILVDADGEPRLLDFGIARRLERESDADATRTGTRAMTPAYASPEQVRGEPLTTASDVYSLGVVLFELLAGARPYSLDGLSAAQSERVICETDPPTLRRAIAGAPLSDSERRARMLRIGGDLERILARALHKDPARRYGSAQALGDDLRRQHAGLPVLAHPDSAGYRIGKFVRRHRVGSAAAVLALLAILAAAGIALLQAQQARRAARDTAQVNAFLVDVLDLSNPYVSDGEITLAAALDEAAAQVDARFGSRPDLAADIRHALGRSMLGRYRLDAAQAQLERSLADSEQAHGPDAPASARAVATLASLRKERGDFARAEAGYADALARLERGGHTRDPLFATVLNDAGVMHLLQEQFAPARGYFERALAAGDAADPPPSAEERAQTLGNLAHALRGLGELDRAEAIYAQVQASFEALYPEGGPYLAIVLNNRARLANQRGRPEQALSLQQQAVAMHRSAFSGDHAMVLTPMTNLARQARDLDRLDLASEWGETAVAMADRMYADAPHAYHVNALAALSDTRLAQGRVGESAQLLQRAIAVLDRVESPPQSTADFVARVRSALCVHPEAVPVAPCALP